MTDNKEDFYLTVVRKIKAGEKFGLWNKLIEYLSTVDESEARINYPNLYKAMKQYDLDVWKNKGISR